LPVSRRTSSPTTPVCKIRATFADPFFLGLIVLIQAAGELIGPEGMTALIYILAGVKN